MPVSDLQVFSFAQPGDAQAHPGDRTSSPRVLWQEITARNAVLVLEGLAGQTYSIPISSKSPTVRAEVSAGDFASAVGKGEPPAATIESLAIEGGQIFGFYLWGLDTRFPPGEGWKTMTVTLTW